MPVRDAGRRRGCCLSLSLLRAVRSRPPRLPQASTDAGNLTTSRNRGQPPGLCTSFLFLFSDAGSRRAYRGRSARPYAQRARATLGTHNPRRRDRRPGCAPGAHTLQTSYQVLAPRNRRGRGGRNPATRGYRPLLPGGKCLGTFPAMFPGQINRRKILPARGGRTPAGVESGGNAEVSYA